MKSQGTVRWVSEDGADETRDSETIRMENGSEAFPEDDDDEQEQKNRKNANRSSKTTKRRKKISVSTPRAYL